MLRFVSTRFALICFFGSSLGLSLLAQQTGQIKEADPAPGQFLEPSSGSAPVLARKESELRSGLGAQPNSPDLLYALAQVLQEEAKSKESLELFTRAAKYRNPTSLDLRSVAFNYVLLGDYEDAIHWLEVASRMDPSNPKILYALGRCYYSNSRFLEAVTMFGRVLAIQPKDMKAEENLGLAYDAANQPDKAEEALRKAASWADPNGTDQWPFLDLGSFLLDHGRAKGAIEPLRRAAKIQPLCASCHEKLGRALTATGDNAGGIAELDDAVTLDPKNPKTHYALGRALRQAGQIDRAQKEFAVCKELYSQHIQE